MENSNEKPRYGLWSCVGYMVNLAWLQCKSVLWLVVAVSVCAVLTSCAGLFAVPMILSSIETKVPLSQLLMLIGTFSIALMGLRALTDYINMNTMFGRIDVRGRVMMSLLEKTMTTSYPNLEKQDFLRLSKKASQSISMNSEATEQIWTTLSELLRDVLGFAVYLTLISALDLRMVVAIGGMTILGFLVTKRINEWGYRHRDVEAGYVQKMDYISAKSTDYTLAKDVRVFQMAGWLKDIFVSAMSLYRNFKSREMRVYIWADVFDLLIALLRNGIAYWMLISMVLNGELSAPQFLLYFTAIGGIANWLSGIMQSISTLHKQGQSLSNVRECLAYPDPFTFEGGESPCLAPDQPCEIELREVSFRYPGAKSDTIHALNLVIKPGERLAVVGLNGAGKTTLVKLICGFLDPTAGSVLLNGKDIRQYNRADYYKAFSAVFQDFSVLASSIAENISQRLDDCDMALAEDCARKAGLMAKVDSLPNGLLTNLGKEVYEDGIILSGGETQLLMLARALYKNAPIVVLDEPTAALDPIAESRIYDNYRSLTEGRTSIYISHRLSSTRFCDRIILIDNGGIAEVGTHDELIGCGGRYAELFEIQSRYYQEGAQEYGAEQEAFA